MLGQLGLMSVLERQKLYGHTAVAGHTLAAGHGSWPSLLWQFSVLHVKESQSPQQE